MMFALSRLLCINYEIAMRKTAVCIGIANCAANVFYLVILALKKKKRKKNHIIHADVWVSWAGAGWGGDYPRFWILNCNIENRLFSVIIDLSILYRFFSLFVLSCFLILPFDGPTTAFCGCMLKITALRKGQTGIFPLQDGDILHD